MTTSLVGRLAVRTALSLLLVTSLSYLLLSLLPGDPVTSVLGTTASPERIAALRAEYRLDDPWLVQYGRWLGDLAQGDLGTSRLTGRSVGEALGDRLPVTIELVVLSQVMALLVAVPLAIRSALRPDGPLDRATTAVSFAALSTPPYVLGVLASLVFALHLRWLPSSGFVPLGEGVVENLRTMLLPAATLAVGSAAAYTRVLRAEMVATLQEDFITIARAKGLSTPYILARHALRPSSFTLVTIAGLNLAGLIGGAVIIERIFAVPGVGGYALGAILQRDYIAAQGAIVTIALGFVLVNLAVDVTYSLLDPRVRRAAA